jgi:subtilase family serine protease/flagellar hook assembly protein FlgD/Tol biopolymer transport system component
MSSLNAARAAVVSGFFAFAALVPSPATAENRGGVVVLRSPTGSYAPGDRGARIDAAKAFYATHADGYDFLVVFPAFPVDVSASVERGETLGRHWPVRAWTTGIGIAPSDAGNDFGSAERLKAVIDVYSLVPGLEHAGFNASLATVAHEIAHQWTAHVTFRDPTTGQRSNALLGLDGAHWSFFLDSDASVMYGSDWREAGAGTFVADASRRRYSALDLYLMGFLAPSEVPPFTLLKPSAGDPQTGASLPPQDGTTISATATQVTIADVIAAEGPRFPSADDSQKLFRAAFAILVGPGQEPSPDQIAFVDSVRREWANRFFFMTRGRALMETELLEAPPGALATEPSPRLGLQWLLARQGADGGWADDPATSTRDSADAVRALGIYPGDAAVDAARANGSAYLGTLALPDTDSGARRLLALRDQEGAAAVIAPPNEDGGYGLGPGYASSVIDSALVALAARSNGGLANRPELVDFLLAAQRGDGGWPYLPGSRSSVEPTAWVLCALAGLPSSLRLQTAVDAGLAFLRASRRADGSYGDDPFSTVSFTAEAMLALDAWGTLSAGEIGDVSDLLLRAQRADGSWEESVHETAEVLRALRVLLGSNLTIGQVSLSRASVHAGETVELTAVVSNAGHGTASGFHVRAFDADGAPFGGGVEVSELLGGATVQVRLALDTTGHAGSNILFVVADPHGRVDELREDDNRTAAELRILPIPVEPDLFVVAGSPIVTPAAVDSLPSRVRLTATIGNAGATSVAEVQVAVLVRGETAVSGPVKVDARSSEALTIDVPISPGPGPVPVRLVIDPQNVIAEADESNNDAALEVPVVASVDLAAVSPTVAPLQAEQGQDVAISYTLANSGTLAAVDTEESIRILDAAGAVVDQVEAHGLMVPGGGALERRVLWNASVAGSLGISIEVTHPQERDPSNNRAMATVVVSPSSRPNLKVRQDDLVVEPSPARQGSPAVARATVHNTGSVTSGPFQVAFFEGDPAAGRRVHASDVSGLAAGEAITVEATYEVAVAHDLVVVTQVDPAGAVDEFDETDNVIAATVQVLGLPDLVVDSGAIVPSNPFPRRGERVDVSVTVVNVGAQGAGPAEVSLYDGLPEAGAGTIGTAPVPALDGGATGTASFGWTPATNGSHTLVAVVRAGGTREASAENNRAERVVPVQDADFALSNPFFSPNGDGVKDETQVLFRLDEAEPVIVEVRDADGELVRALESSGPVVAGGMAWDGRDAAGETVRDGKYALTAFAAGEAREVIGTVEAVVDLNRTPLHDVTGTQLLQSEALAGRIPEIAYSEWSFAPMPDDSGVVGYGCVDENTCAIYSIAPGDREATFLTPPGTVNSSYSERPWRMGVAPDASRIAYVTYYGEIVVYSTTERTFTTLDVGDTVYNLAPIVWSPDGSELMYQTHRGVELRNVATNEFRVLYDWMGAEYAFSPDGEWISIIDWSGQIRLYRRDGSGEMIVAPEESLYWPDVDVGWRHAWTANGKAIAFVAAHKGISYVDLETLEIHPLYVAPEEEQGQFELYTSIAASRRDLVVAFQHQPGGWRDGEYTEVLVTRSADEVPRVLYRPGGGILYYLGWSPFETFAWVYFGADRGNYETWQLITSLANLSGRVAATRPPGEAELSFYGTAADLNFDRFQLAVRPDRSSAPLQQIASGTAPVVDGLMAKWTPPAEGLYEAVLTVSDKAGNVRVKRSRFAWNTTPAIANVSRDPEYISPNADGVQDEATIKYSATKPVTIDFLVRDAAGQAVRHIPVTQLAAGDYQTRWDGKDDAGSLVADGVYELVIGGARRRVVVDTVAPKVELALLDRLPPEGANEFALGSIPGLPRPSSGMPLFGVPWGSYKWAGKWPEAPQVLLNLSWKASDLNLHQWHLETPDGELDASGFEQSEQNVSIPMYLARRETYRLRARDLAGNESRTAEMAPTERVFALAAGSWEMLDENQSGFAGLGYPHYRVTHQILNIPPVHSLVDDPEPVPVTHARGAWLAVAIDAGLRQDAVSYALSYRLANEEQWTTVPVTGVREVGVWWDPPVPDPLGAEVRVHVTDVLGRTFSTQSFVIGRPPVPGSGNVRKCAWAENHGGTSTLDIGMMGPLVHQGTLELRSTDGLDHDRLLDLSTLEWLDDEHVSLARADLPGCSYRGTLRGTTTGTGGGDFQTDVWVDLCTFRVRDIYTEGQTAFLTIEEDFPTPLDAVDVYLQRDPSVNEWHLGAHVASFEGVSPVVAIDLADAKQGSTIPVRLVARLASGETVDSVEMAQDECNPKGLTGIGVPELVARIGAPIRELVSPQACASTEALYTFPVSVEGAVDVIQVEAALVTPSGRPVVPVAVDGFTPGPSVHTGVVVTTAALAPGEYHLAVEARDASGHVARAQRGAAIVDSTPPLVALTSPAPQALACPVERPLSSGGSARVLVVEGSASDEHLGEYSVQLRRRDDPQWRTVSARQLDASSGVAIAGTLAEIDVAGYSSGDYVLRLEARDGGGAAACSPEIPFHLDAGVTLSGLSATPRLFSPDGDGAFEATTLGFQLGDQASVALMLADPGVPSETLSTQDLGAGSGVLAWDGRRADGTVVADGARVLTLVASDRCGGSARASTTAELDTAPPVVLIDGPRPGTVVAAAGPLLGRVADAHIAGYRASLGDGASPAAFVPFAQAAANVSGALGALPLTGLPPGEYTVRLEAWDQVGHAAATEVTFTWAPRALLEGFEIAPVAVSPNGDGIRDGATATVRLIGPGALTLDILREDGAVFAQAVGDQDAPSGATAFALDAALAAVPDDTYRVRVTARAAGVEDTATQPIIVDRVPPSITVESPGRDGFVRGAAELAAAVDDPILERWSVSLRSGNEDRTLASGSSRASGALARVADLADAPYAAVFFAEDQAGNRREEVVPFVSDTTPPQVAITSPLPDEFISSRAGPVLVTGTLTEANPASWRLEIATSEAPGLFRPIADGEAWPAGVLAIWDPSAEPDGPAVLRVTAVDGAGNAREATVAITIDHTPPTVAIVSPRDTFLHADEPVIGTARDANLAGFTVELADGAPGAAYRFSEIAAGSAAVENGVLAQLAGQPVEGTYALRVTATDRAGNTASDLAAFEVDRTPPQPPPALVATLRPRSDGVLEWQPSPSEDVVGYRLQRAIGGGGLQPVGPELVAGTTWTDPALRDGSYRYVVLAVDAAGLVSVPSPEAELEVDTRPPMAIISHPASGVRVHGLVEVRGTAYSITGFQEYRLSAGEGAAPAAFDLLRGSRASVVAGDLGELDSTAYAEGATVTIRLEAEDLAGNVAEARATVVVDNLAPPAPVLVSATPEGADVALEWTPVEVPDLAGYLVYRNGAPVNVPPGADLTDPTPWLVPAGMTTFTDPDVPDGAFEYQVQAVDLAANLSALSNGIGVTLDRRPPVARVVRPEPLARLTGAVEVVAEVPDQDVAWVQIEARDASSGAPFLPVGPALGAPPFSTQLDPGSFGAVIEVRARATDLGGLTDPSPESTFFFSAPPLAPPEVSPHVDESLVSVAFTDPNPAGRVVAVAVTEGGSVLNASQAGVTFTASSSMSGYRPEAGWDSNSSSCWRPVDGAGQWWQETFQQGMVIESMMISPWGGVFDLWFRVQGTWVPVQRGVQAGRYGWVELPVDPPIFADAIQIRFTTSRDNGLCEAMFSAKGISHLPIQQDLSWRSDGSYTYGVTLYGAAGQSASGSGVARLYRPVLDPVASVVASPDLLARGGDAAAGGLVQVLVDGAPGGQGPAGDDGRFEVPLTLHLGVNTLVAQATDALGNRSRKSDPRTVRFEAPPDVTIALALDGVQGSDVALSFTLAGDAGTVGAFAVIRSAGGAESVVGRLPADARAFVDRGVANGTYLYWIRPLAASGIAGAPSNTVSAVVSVPLAAAPALTVTVPPRGGALDLAWTYEGNAWFTIERAIGGGAFTRIGGLVPGRSYEDIGLTNGTTYRYRVTAVDDAGNSGVPSNEASGVPRDTAGPRTPIIDQPTVAGAPIRTVSPRETVGGIAELNALVELRQNGRYTGQDVADVPAASRVPVATALPASGPFDVAAGGAPLVYAYSDASGQGVAFEWPSSGELIALSAGDVSDGPVLAPDGLRAAFTVYVSGRGDVLHVADARSGTVEPALAAAPGGDSSPAWSPDGKRLAYLVERDRPGVAVLDLASGVETVFPEQYWGARQLRWIDDQAIAFVTSWDEILVRYDVASGERTVLARRRSIDCWAASASGAIALSGADDRYEEHVWILDGGGIRRVLDGGAGALAFSPDGDRLAAVDGGQLRVIPLRGSAQELGYVGWGALLWRGPDDLYLAGYERPQRVERNGRFEVPVALDAGRNLFLATAADDAGNRSTPSEEIQVDLDSSALPDLAVTLRLDPPVPSLGQTVQALAMVRNVGAGASTGGTVAVVLTRPDGSSARPAPISLPPLPAGASVTAIVPLDAGAAAGERVVTATADPPAGEPDRDPTNNRDELRFLLVEQGGVAMTLDANPRTVSADGAVLATVTLSNSGAACNARLRIALADGEGAVAVAVPERPLSLAAGTVAQEAFEIPVGRVLAGDYQIIAELLDEDGSLARASLPVTVSRSRIVTLVLESWRDWYSSDEPLAFTSRVENLSPNAPLDGAVHELAILDGAGALVAKAPPSPLPLLWMGGDAVVGTELPAGLTPGTYSARAWVHLGGEVLADSTTSFAVVGRPALVGRIEVAASGDPPTVRSGAVAEIGLAVRNAGTEAAPATRVVLSVVDANGAHVLDDDAVAGELAPDDSYARTVYVPTGGLALGVYGLSLSAEHDGVVEVLATSRLRVADGRPPALVLLSPLDGTFVRGALTASVRALDDASGTAAVRAAVAGRIEALHLTAGSPLDGEWSERIPLGQDGIYDLVISAADAAGNDGLLAPSIANPIALRVVNDLTPPAVAIEGVTNGALVNTVVAPIVTATDAWLTSVEARLNGAAFEPGTVVVLDGDYLLSAQATDRAGNVGTAVVSFAVDRTPPVIAVLGIDDGAYIARDVTPLVVVTDLHLDGYEAWLDGVPLMDGATLREERPYVLSVDARDRAGNAAAQTLAFTIDKTAPRVVIEGVADGAFVNQPVAPVVTIEDANLLLARTTLDGADWASGTTIVEEGTHALHAVGTDRAGLRAEATVTFTVDRTPPEIALSGIAGRFSRVDVTPVFSAADANLASTVATMDGAPFVSGATISAEGPHQLRIVARDRAGNETHREADFVIDRTPPTLALSGVEEGAYVVGPVAVAVDASDPYLARVAATLDGGAYAPGAPIEAEGSHTVSARAEDEAGNSVTASLRFTIDRTPPRIVIEGVRDGEVTAVDVVPVISVTDTNLAGYDAVLDGALFLPGGTVREEGSHRLEVVARDLAQQETRVAVAFEIDRSPPQIWTNVADGAEFGEPIAVEFGATDPHLAEVTATLDGVPISSGAVVSGEGAHRLAIEARDSAGNAAALSASFTIAPPVRYQVVKRVPDRFSRVLVRLPCREEPAARTEAFLRAALPDTPLTFVQNDIDLLVELRSGVHGVVVLMDVHGANARGGCHSACPPTRPVPPLWPGVLGARVEQELTESVFRGTGLVALRATQAAWPKLAEALGLGFGGDVPASAVDVRASALSAAMHLRVPDGVELRLDGALGVATFVRDGGTSSRMAALKTGSDATASCVGGARPAPAVAMHAFGTGAAVTLGFDPSLAAPDTDAAELVRGAVAFASPEQALSPGGVVGVEIGITATGSSALTRIREELDPALQLVSVLDDGEWTPATGTIEWLAQLDHGETDRLSYLVRLPAEAGTYRTTAEVTALLASGEHVAGTYPLDLVLERGAPGLLEDADKLARALPAKGPDAAKRATILARLDAVRRNHGACAADRERAIGDLLVAVDRTKALRTADPTALRLALDALIAFWEARP